MKIGTVHSVIRLRNLVLLVQKLGNEHLQGRKGEGRAKIRELEGRQTSTGQVKDGEPKIPKSAIGQGGF